MSGSSSQEFLRSLREENALLRERERELEERNEELSAQKEELTAAIEAFMEKSDTLEGTVLKLERRNHELDEILYRTSHDLLAPLTSIEGLMHIFQKEGQAENALSATISQHVMAKVYQMKDVLKALGTLAHASFDTFSYSQVNVLNHVGNLVNELVYLPNFKCVSFTYVIDDDLVFETDPFLFGILVKSLVANAVIFRDGENKGEVVISAAHTERGFEFRVEDDGEGIGAESQEKVFIMFYRGSVRSIGPGLGLYVVKTLVERFNGAIHFTSTPGKTCFTLIMPIDKKKTA